jgi:hypothetical protein
MENEVELYFGAMNKAHGSSVAGGKQTAKIAKATWRRDGFISLCNGGSDPGIITTKKLAFPEHFSSLKVNADLYSGGFLKAEILDEEGNVLPGFSLDKAKPISGDRKTETVCWEGGGEDLESLTGKALKLRFHLKSGHLYSYWFE